MDANTKIESDSGIPDGAPPYSRSIVLSRVFDAPLELMWRMWTDPVHIVHWFGPEHFTNHSVKVDLRVGGTLELTMQAPDGSNHPMKCIFSEIIDGESLSFSNDAFDADGNKLLDGRTTVRFEEVNGKTKVILEAKATGTADITKFMLGGMKDGWAQSWDKLAAYLPQVV